MDTQCPASSFTVFFEEPFWVGVYERHDSGRYEVCKVTFGAEPKDYQVYAFLLENWHKLRFSPALADAPPPAACANPKRLQRQIRRQLQSTGPGTKAQQALKLQQEQGRQARAVRTRAQREAEKERAFALRAEKRRQKHRGR